MGGKPGGANCKSIIGGAATVGTANGLADGLRAMRLRDLIFFFTAKLQ
jgi:hypothetical protein